MTLPDKLHNYDISLTKLDKLCSSNELELEIIKRYNEHPKLYEIKTLLENIIVELEQDILHKLQSIDSQHHHIESLEQENKELKEYVEQCNRDHDYLRTEIIPPLENSLDKSQQQYNKLRDAIKNRQEQLHDYNIQMFKQLQEHKISLEESIEKQRTYNGEIKELQSILDSVENEK